MSFDATKEQIEPVEEEMKKYGLSADVSRGAYKTVIGLIRDGRKAPFSHLTALLGVKEMVIARKNRSDNNNG
jgi:3-deoxy-7-phosphoheptulonate synthase